MRSRVPWMNETDDAILEFLEVLGTPGGEPVVIAPQDVWLNLNQLRGVTDKAPNTISRRMGRLESMRLLKNSSATKASTTPSRREAEVTSRASWTPRSWSPPSNRRD